MSSKNNGSRGGLGAIKDGFFFGLIGAAVRKEVDGNRVVTGSRFAAKDCKLVVDNLEAPYPLTEEAARKMAEDCTTTVHYFDGTEIKSRKLTGIVAAVAIARDGRPVETLRQRMKNGGLKGENQVREAAAALYTFSAGERPPVSVESNALAAIFADENATAEQKLAAVTAMLAQAGAVVK